MTREKKLAMPFHQLEPPEEIARLSADGTTLTIHLDKMPGGTVFIDYPDKRASWKVASWAGPVAKISKRVKP